jgi:hypothetical protein
MPTNCFTNSSSGIMVSNFNQRFDVDQQHFAPLVELSASLIGSDL